MTAMCRGSLISPVLRFFSGEIPGFLRLGVTMRTVSSPAMVPAISWNFAPSTAAAKGCGATRRRFEDQQILRGRMSSRNSRSARISGGNGGGFFRQTGARPVALVCFDELQFLQIAGKRGLGHAQTFAWRGGDGVLPDWRCVRRKPGGESVRGEMSLSRSSRMPYANVLYIIQFSGQSVNSIAPASCAFLRPTRHLPVNGIWTMMGFCTKLLSRKPRCTGCAGPCRNRSQP